MVEFINHMNYDITYHKKYNQHGCPKASIEPLNAREFGLVFSFERNNADFAFCLWLETFDCAFGM